MLADVNGATWFATWDMYVRRHGALVTVQAPAKLNFFLEVLARRDDGFHEIETLMIPVRAFDTLILSPCPQGAIHMDCRWGAGSLGEPNAERVWADLPTGPDNLVYRALDCLRRAAGVDRGATVRLTKRIPAMAGLGGGSSDAAAALLAGNELWQIGWSASRLADLAAEIGSDVPFFLHSGAARCGGRGERIEPLAGLPALHVVVGHPPVGLSTADVYGRCRPAGKGRTAACLIDALREGRIEGVRDQLFNRLQEAAESLTPWIGRLRAAFDRAGCDAHQMSGSGTSYFGLCRHASHARRVAGRLRAAGMGHVFPTTTLPLAFHRT